MYRLTTHLTGTDTAEEYPTMFHATLDLATFARELGLSIGVDGEPTEDDDDDEVRAVGDLFNTANPTYVVGYWSIVSAA